MAAPKEVHRLVERFEENRDAYRSGEYNEAQARVDFINPLFTLLGWDIDNRQGRPEAYREVVYEDRIKVGGGTKAPDYGFYTAGTRRFFLEAKKPSVDIAGDVAPAVQLRRYAWSARLPLSVLTDFEEFAVYDCRFEPQKEDGPATARLEIFTYDRYAEEEVWARISSLFSREAVLSGSLERYAEANRRRRGTETVDAAFLREIEGWRSALARDLAARNDLNDRQLNYAVQMTIDRIIFLRMAEDRGIEDYGRLLGLVNGNGVYGRLRELFQEADDRYDSGLFHFRRERDRDEEPDGLTLSLEIDDGVLREIIRSLYYPESPYEFSVLPVDVLGQVYEQFLGRVIRLEDGHRATVEEKPEVRKAGGVYYTPTYIVDYIVEKTVGKLLEGKRPGPRGGASRIKIMDPACGSGSFLIGAYRYLLDWHRDRYVEDGPENWKDRLYEGPGGQHHLTIDEKKRILLNNIYGVDIDPQAVEVTKLSLLLKVLEGESEASLATQLRMFQERALPDLDDNIKCGNSLIGPDFYDNEQMMLLDEEEHYRINVFDWREAFPHVFEGDNPGFDAVIGNPPYLAGREWTDFLRMQRPYFKDHYNCMTDQYDLYALFIQRAIELLCINGLFGFITPTTWLNNEHYIRLRQWLLERANIEHLADYRRVEVFADATVLPVVLVASRTDSPGFGKRFLVETFDEALSSQLLTTSVRVWNEFPNLIFNLSVSEVNLPILKRIEKASDPVSSYGDVRFGVKVYQRGKGVPPQTGEEARERRFESQTKENDSYYPYVRGRYVTMWRIEADRAWLDYGPHLAEPRYFELFVGPRVLVRRIAGDRLIVAPTTETLIADQLLHTVKPIQDGVEHRFLAGVLASKLVSYYFRKRFNRTERTFPEIRVGELAQLPIRTIDFSDPEDAARHDRMVGLVERMLELHERLAGARIERERTVIGHQISTTDRQIDSLVYDLYGLTEKEIMVVEENS